LAGRSQGQAGDCIGPIGINESIGAQTPDYFKKLLSIGWSGGNHSRFNRVMGLPCVETAGQSRVCEAKFPQLLHHTDAGGVAWSTAIGDVLLIEPAAPQEKPADKEHQWEGKRWTLNQSGGEGGHREDNGNYPKDRNKTGELALLLENCLSRQYQLQEQSIARATTASG